MGRDYKIDGRDFFKGWSLDSFEDFAKKIRKGELPTPSDEGFADICIQFFIDKGYSK